MTLHIIGLIKMGDFENWKNSYLGYVDKIIGFIPYGRMREWKEFGLDPLPKVSKPDTIMQRVKDIYVMQVTNICLMLVAAIPIFIIFGLMSLLMMGIPLIMLAFWAAAIVVGIIISPLFTLIYCAVEHAVARMLGGVGDFKTHFNAAVASGLAVFTLELPLTILMIPLMWVVWVPCLGTILMMPVSIGRTAISLYGLYLRFTSYRKLHALTDGKSAAVILVPILLWIILMVVLVVLMYATIFAFMFSMAAAVGAGGAASS